MKIKMLLTVMAIFLLAAGSASAAIVSTLANYATEAEAIQALDNWRGDFYVDLLEDFEGFRSEVPVGHLPGYTTTSGQSSYTSFGQTQFYVDGGLAGTGSMRLGDPTNFGVMYRDVAKNGNYGRTLGWEADSWFGEQYLDSGDITRFSLNHNLADLQLTSLFFFMFDVSDIDGRLIVTMGDGSSVVIGGLTPEQANGEITFLGIQTTEGDFISKLTWEMDSDADGFGLDNFGTLNPIPIPGSVLLLSSGLLGMVFMRRRLMKR